MPRTVGRIWLLWALLLLAAGAACGRDERTGEVLVLAAASLTEVMDEIGTGYEEATGIDVRFSYGGSDSLAAQIRNGAPADAVVFAGAGPLDALEAGGFTVPGGRRSVAANRLVVIAQASSGTALGSLAELAAENSGKVAIADPQLAPAGRYARAALEAAGVWDAVSPRLIPGLDVRNAAAAVTAGTAQFGFVYETDAAAMSGVKVVYVVPAELYPRILYPAAVVSASRNQAQAGAFLEYLGGPRAREVFTRHGFQPVP
ncbi:MAG: molybdate ABC transporter substrate-binding protein [Chloroflexi bacterium]|nr:molybdate ABC transporter substrate-binding protein [Chloroflexota bacterium]